jgi:alpha-beta hydrolase superfamily lysophospholipase
LVDMLLVKGFAFQGLRSAPRSTTVIGKNRDGARGHVRKSGAALALSAVLAFTPAAATTTTLRSPDAPRQPAAARAAAARGAAARLPVRVVRFTYTTHDRRQSYALLLLPGWYGPRRHPAIPLVVCPHGRNTQPEGAARRWFDLPSRGGFAVVLPAGQGRVLQLDSWGYRGQIADLARMPALAQRAVPGFHYLRRRVYAVGASMGGQEVLLLLARDPGLLAGVIAFDPATDLANRYYEFPDISFGRQDQQRARIEVGGTPRQLPQAYRVRSPITYVRRIALSHVPLQVWWSIRDQVIVNQAQQAGRFYQEVKLINPRAPVVPYVGTWPHTGEVSAFAQLPAALARLGLLPASWLVHDPYRPHQNGGRRTLVTQGRRPSDSEVSQMVERAQIQIGERLDLANSRSPGWWRWAFIALAAAAAPLTAAMAIRIRMLRRRIPATSDHSR